ncbi:MAG TPA: hypothetical protein VJ023_17405 [Pyrinomonadaceae bacterium]|nr:hypothetical protein [Pyrinomonadaceae bacterium]
MSTMLEKRADLAGPGIGNYEELEKVLPQNYKTLLSPRDTQRLTNTWWLATARMIWSDRRSSFYDVRRWD